MATVRRREERKLAYDLGWDPDNLKKYQRLHIKRVIHNPSAELERQTLKEMKKTL